MNLISFLVQSSWRMMTIAIVAGVMSGGSSAALIALINRAIGQGFGDGGGAIAFVAVAAIALASSILSQMMLIRVAQQAIFQLRLSLSRQILASELAHLEAMGTPRILATLTEDVQAVADAVRLVPFLCIDLATVAGCLVYVTWLSWQVSLLVFGLISLTLTGYRWLLRRAKGKLALARDEQDQLFKHFRSITDGIKELKLHYGRRQAFLRDDLQTAAANYRRYNVQGLDLFAVIINFGNFVFFLAIALVLFTLPRLLLLSGQTLTAYVLTFTYMMVPLQNLVSRLPVLSRAGVSLDKIQSLNLSLRDRAEAHTVPAKADRPWRMLQLQAVTHAYGRGEDAFTLGPIDLTLHPGELVFIVGGNGSGKSTLAKLITGLYLPESGEIWFDETPIDAANREWYRQHFATIFSDFFLFDRLLGFENPNLQAQAQEYLQLLHLDRKVTLHQGNLSTIALSQGQRKRLALLTAYLDDRPIYLFDEWAADQDPTFKEIFYTQLLPQLRDRGKTVLVITHDDQYFHLGDRLIQMDYGQIRSDKQHR